jgi:hypothetical protein
MVFKATFNNISVKSWRSVLLMEETGVPEEDLKTQNTIINIMKTNQIRMLISVSNGY